MLEKLIEEGSTVRFLNCARRIEENEPFSFVSDTRKFEDSDEYDDSIDSDDASFQPGCQR